MGRLQSVWQQLLMGKPTTALNQFLRVTQRFIHFVGQTDTDGNSLEFTESRRYIVRMTRIFAADIALNNFNSSVSLPDSIANDPKYTAHGYAEH